jgi:hypothetical protein
MSDKPWKKFERRVADVSGGKRIPINGRQQLDVDHPYLGIECKYRQQLPEWLFGDKGAWGQASVGSKKDDLIPTIVVGAKNSTDMFAIVKLETLVELLAMALDEEYIPSNSYPAPIL